MKDIRDSKKVVETFSSVKDFFAGLWAKPNVRRWIIEGVASVAIGILAACLTFHTLNKPKALEVSQKGAEAPIVEGETEVNGEGLPADDPDADVVIEVVEGVEDVPAEFTDVAEEVSGWSNEEIDAAISERSGYLSSTKYSSVVGSFWESKRGVTDVAWQSMHMFDTDTKLYTAADFEGMSPEAIHAAKNEIYARHGYSFKDQDLYNYFMCYIWYNPSVMPADFSESVFNETEVKNLDLLNELDTM
ncbi:MAG: YARHG domain-containing protein [Pseudobutyrivibrio sp.]|nr:YARHG domain-containing protein [Pseudobutyrivibrio sp.]